MIDKSKLAADLTISHQDAYRGDYKGVSFKIYHWGKGETYTPGGQGIWNYYIYIPESKALDFSLWWLEPELQDSLVPGHQLVHYPYFSLPIHFVGGATFYEKHGEVVGHRCVEIGCDYNHSWNYQHPPTFEQVVKDLLHTIDTLQPLLKQN